MYLSWAKIDDSKEKRNWTKPRKKFHEEAQKKKNNGEKIPKLGKKEKNELGQKSVMKTFLHYLFCKKYVSWNFAEKNTISVSIIFWPPMRRGGMSIFCNQQFFLNWFQFLEMDAIQLIFWQEASLTTGLSKLGRFSNWNDLSKRPYSWLSNIFENALALKSRKTMLQPF